MEEIILVTCGKEDEGMVAIDLSHGSSCTSYKNCVAESGALCVVQSDFIICSQAQKPCINIWRWGKVQVQFQCHIQEITTSLAVDSSGTYLVSGTKRGWLYCWELSTGELITSLQAHFKSVTRVAVTKCGNYVVSVSEDGNGRVFELCKIVDSSSSSAASSTNVSYSSNSNSSSVSYYRSWSPHTLPIKDCHVLESFTCLRVATGSLDRSVVIYDVHQATVVLRLSFPASIESLTCNSTQDFLCAGGSTGSIYLVDLTMTAAALSTSHSLVRHQSVVNKPVVAGGAGAGKQLECGENGSVFVGHSKTVTSLCFSSSDNSILVSGSIDGSVRTWNVLTRQCLNEYYPLSRLGITNLAVLRPPESFPLQHLSHTGPGPLSTVQHLQKYPKRRSDDDNVVGNSIKKGGLLVLGPTALHRHDDLIDPVLSYVENEESGGGQQSTGEVVLDEVMLFEDPNEGHATAARDRRKAEWIERKGSEGHGSIAASHQLRPVDSNALKRKTRSIQ